MIPSGVRSTGVVLLVTDAQKLREKSSGIVTGACLILDDFAFNSYNQHGKLNRNKLNFFGNTQVELAYGARPSIISFFSYNKNLILHSSGLSLLG